MDTQNQSQQGAVSRRGFLSGAGALGAAAVLTGCGSTTPITTTGSTSETLSDVDILTFALNLEYLEAEFYLRAATGSGLSATDAGASAGAVTGGSKLTGITALQQEILNEIAFDEMTHVQFLRSAITAAGSTPVSRPAIDLTFFGPLATAANISLTGGTTFNPFTLGWDAFLVGAFVFEDVGVTAYNGAAPFISAAGVKAGYLSAAAGILAVEAYHAGYVRTALTAAAITGGSSYPYLGYANQVSALRATLGGGNETPLTTASPSTVVAASSSALAYTRTVDQIHHIVYGSATIGVGKGGFFPNGTNFKYSTTLA